MDSTSMNQWSIYIDIEGFGATYEQGSQALNSLRGLMEAIYRIGTYTYSETPDRLFAHQIGDGFVIVGEFGSETLEDPLSISIAILRSILVCGGMSKAAISEGQFADIVGCYPTTIRDAYSKANGGAIPLGDGLMTIFPVMGTALINSHKLLHSKKTPSGSLLILDRANSVRLPEGTISKTVGNLIIIDWVHSSYPYLQKIINHSKLPNKDTDTLCSLVKQYIEDNEVAEEWSVNTRNYLNIK